MESSGLRRVPKEPGKVAALKELTMSLGVDEVNTAL